MTSLPYMSTDHRESNHKIRRVTGSDRNHGTHLILREMGIMKDKDSRSLYTVQDHTELTIGYHGTHDRTSGANRASDRDPETQRTYDHDKKAGDHEPTITLSRRRVDWR